MFSLDNNREKLMRNKTEKGREHKKRDRSHIFIHIYIHTYTEIQILITQANTASYKANALKFQSYPAFSFSQV